MAWYRFPRAQLRAPFVTRHRKTPRIPGWVPWFAPIYIWCSVLFGDSVAFHDSHNCFALRSTRYGYRRFLFLSCCYLGNKKQAILNNIRLKSNGFLIPYSSRDVIWRSVHHSSSVPTTIRDRCDVGIFLVGTRETTTAVATKNFHKTIRLMNKNNLSGYALYNVIHVFAILCKITPWVDRIQGSSIYALYKLNEWNNHGVAQILLSLNTYVALADW